MINDKNLKKGNYLVCVKPYNQFFGKFFTPNHTYLIRDVQLNFIIINDNISSSMFKIDSDLGRCFETLQENRKKKLNQLKLCS